MIERLQPLIEWREHPRREPQIELMIDTFKMYLSSLPSNPATKSKRL
jgi:hypothetical protein